MRPGAMAAVESMLGGIVPVLLLAAALVAGGLVHAQQSRSPPAGVPTAPTAAAPFKKPKIAEKAEEIYKKITATGFYPTIRGLAAGTGIVRAETTFDPEELDGTPGLPPIPGEASHSRRPSDGHLRREGRRKGRSLLLPAVSGGKPHAPKLPAVPLPRDAPPGLLRRVPPRPSPFPGAGRARTAESAGASASPAASPSEPGTG